MWQSSSTGKVSGINGNVDTDIAYKDYPTIIKNAGLNGFEKPSTSKPEEADPDAGVPEWQRAAFDKLVEQGVITTPEHWKGRLAQQITVGEVMAIVANTIKD